MARNPWASHEKPELRTPIQAIRLASDVPEVDGTPLQLLRTDSPAADATEAHRNCRDGWYVQPAGHIDVCNAGCQCALQNSESVARLEHSVTRGFSIDLLTPGIAALYPGLHVRA